MYLHLFHFSLSAVLTLEQHQLRKLNMTPKILLQTLIHHLQNYNAGSL